MGNLNEESYGPKADEFLQVYLLDGHGTRRELPFPVRRTVAHLPRTKSPPVSNRLLQ